LNVISVQVLGVTILPFYLIIVDVHAYGRNEP